MCDWVYKCRYDITPILNDHYNHNKIFLVEIICKVLKLSRLILYHQPW